MGITIHYRGTIDDPSRVEEMEDRVVDAVFALGGRATVWRSYSDTDEKRIVRGLIVDMAPGQEAFSLLLSPEGHLTPVYQIEEAEIEPFDEPPWCSVKTQFGSVEGHAAIACLLDALRHTYVSNLTVNDESGFFQHRDITQLAASMRQLNRAIQGLELALQHFDLTEEAAEDPEIVAARVERVARLVRDRLSGDGDVNTETPNDPETQEWTALSLESEVKACEQQRQRNDTRGERIARRLAECCASGLTFREAFEAAMSEEGLALAEADDELPGDEACRQLAAESDDASWEASLPFSDRDDSVGAQVESPHPAVLKAQQLMLELMRECGTDGGDNSFLSIARRGVTDVLGGLVQATSQIDGSQLHRALQITQLRRALRGCAFARGAAFGMRHGGVMDASDVAGMHEQLTQIRESIHELLSEAWSEDTFE